MYMYIYKYVYVWIYYMQTYIRYIYIRYEYYRGHISGELARRNMYLYKNMWINQIYLYFSNMYIRNIYYRGHGFGEFARNSSTNAASPYKQVMSRSSVLSHRREWVLLHDNYYGVATISRMLKNIGLFCKRDLQKRPIFCKETYIFKHPTHRSHPIFIFSQVDYGRRIWVYNMNICKYLYYDIYIWVYNMNICEYL